MSMQDADLPSNGAFGGAERERRSHSPGAGPPTTTGSIPIVLASHYPPAKPTVGTSAADFPRDSLSEDLLPSSFGLGAGFMGDAYYVL